MRDKRLDLPDTIAHKIIMYHVLEHATSPTFLLEECRRVLRPGGELDIKVPHHSNPRAFEIHHRSYWNLFSLEPILGEGHKSNEQQKMFEVVQIELRLLRFNFLAPFCLRHRFLYGMYLWHMLPAYEIRFVLKKHHNDEHDAHQKSISPPSC
jgi:SAM-dependent methyltransferase